MTDIFDATQAVLSAYDREKLIELARRRHADKMRPYREQRAKKNRQQKQSRKRNRSK